MMAGYGGASWAIAPKHCFLLDTECLWERLSRYPLLVRRYHFPTAGFAFDCMNGTKDVWKSLKQICDVAEVIRAHQSSIGTKS